MTLVSPVQPFVDSFQSVGMRGAHQLMAQRYTSDYIYMEKLADQISRRGFDVPPEEAASGSDERGASGPLSISESDPLFNTTRRRWESTADVSGFTYRDYGLSLWNVLRGYVLGVLGSEPRYAVGKSLSEKQRGLAADVELQSFLHELFSPSAAGLPLRNRADPRGDFVALVDLLTQIIFQATAQHAAINFPQYDYLAFAPIRPLTLRLAMPRDVSTLREIDILHALVDEEGQQVMLTTYSILSTPPGETLLTAGAPGNSEARAGLLLARAQVAHFAEETPFPAQWSALQATLRRLEEQQRQHNRQHRFTYPYLYPSQIPTSTAI